VFLEAVRLDALRGALMREIAVTRNRRMSSAPQGRIGSPEARGIGQGSADVEDKIKKMRAAVTNHLSIVPELMEEVQVGPRPTARITQQTSFYLSFYVSFYPPPGTKSDIFTSIQLFF
jgi:hypothetical protein